MAAAAAPLCLQRPARGGEDGFAPVIPAHPVTGCGLAPQDLKRIFKRFYRAASNDQVKIKGTGLGLFLVRVIARQHGGDVRAESAGPGRGSIMYLKLPLAIGNSMAGMEDIH